MSGGAKNYFNHVARTPILGIGVIIISAISTYLNTPMIIPVFAASLYTILLIDSENSTSLKHIGFSHIISFLIAMMAPVIFSIFGFNITNFAGVIIVGILVFITALIQTIMRLEHPPAIAIILVLFGTNSGTGILIGGLIPLTLLVSFVASLIIVLLVAKWADDHKTF